MTLPDNWWIDDMDDGPCDYCGATPSKGMGHGRYICKACYEAMWCPKCSFALTENHTCPSPEEIKRSNDETNRLLAELGIEDNEEAETT